MNLWTLRAALEWNADWRRPQQRRKQFVESHWLTIDDESVKTVALKARVYRFIVYLNDYNEETIAGVERWGINGRKRPQIKSIVVVNLYSNCRSYRRRVSQACSNIQIFDCHTWSWIFWLRLSPQSNIERGDEEKWHESPFVASGTPVEKRLGDSINYNHLLGRVWCQRFVSFIIRRLLSFTFYPWETWITSFFLLLKTSTRDDLYSKYFFAW